MFNKIFAFVVSVVSTLALNGIFIPIARGTPPDIVGQWELVTPALPYFPVHVNLLPTGKVIIWPGDVGISGNDPRAWDPSDNSVTNLSKPGYDLFCVGHVSLADGSLFLAGGHISNFVGLPKASKYDFLTDTWTTLPNMNAGRWYPTTAILANGDVLTISGDIDTTLGGNPLPQVFEVSKGTWRNLTTAQMQVINYPWMFLAPNGKMFFAGHSATTRYLDTKGTGAWSMVATRPGGWRDYGSAVMYAPGKILVMGGDQQPVKSSAEVIDLNQVTPVWRMIDPMQYARRHLNSTLLPDGKVLVTGGTSSPAFNEPAGHVDAAEMWDPATEKWTTLASASGIPRIYHSTALLLPDGRVFTTGGNNHPEIEIFSPPYLFKGARPTVTTAPSEVTYGASFNVKTPDYASISKVTVIRIGSVTHAFNVGQVINELNFSKTADGLNITAPASPNIAPPGYYMIFILNENGVPSIAKFIKIGAGANPTVSVTAPQNAMSVGGPVVTIAAEAADNIGVSGVQFKIDGVNIGAEDTSSPYSITWDSSQVTDGAHVITASARDADGHVTTSAGININVNNSALLPDLVVTSLSYANGIFTSTVKNQGSAPTPAGTTFGMKYSVNGVYRTWSNFSTPVAVGQTVTIGTKGAPYFIPDGPAVATAFVDDQKKIVEIEENNNILTQTVTGGVLDNVNPTVSITSPSSNSTVSGNSVVISANASDDKAVAGVQFSVTGGYPLPEVTTPPYSLVWDSTAVVDGVHTVVATARDTSGNTASSSLAITVNNSINPVDNINPTVSITSPSNNSTVSGKSVVISANATDNIAVAGVKFSVTGGDPLSEDLTAPYSLVWDSTTVADGVHTIVATARDTAGNTASSSFNVTVDNSSPKPDVIVTQLSYANGIFTSVVKNQGTAPTPSGVTVDVSYLVDGKYQTWGSVWGPLAAGASATIGTKGQPYTIPGGIHTMTAFVDNQNKYAELDETNNKLTLSVVNPKPGVSVTAPIQGSTISGSSVIVSANATDDIGVLGVQFKLDGTNLGSEDTTAPYTVNWNSTTVPDGQHTITAVARDADGNTTESAVITVTVNNANNTGLLPDLVVTQFSYANGIFTAVVKNQGNAATPSGVTVDVKYLVDGKYQTWGSVWGPLAAGASATIGTKGPFYVIPSGAHTITAFADDQNKHVESNETNNKVTNSIQIP
ncbi:MAG TPA: Ig-like domain-containing protein [Nitrosomonas sp.]|nr:Ig-like domain-containing protein [Nitrosomonas sp.]HQX13655.1 Ig-like domain-containing protein [Nitrosomonas sp.]HRB31572.1 Ig-like domain-containing protein [Nitrosomonas sp.]HRB44588.1 Ig-like domain-containing protein [Nitrosomonas sp.]HRB76567.1 Ig-like domain-containing protein [Nitrosomonas sp.]